MTETKPLILMKLFSKGSAFKTIILCESSDILLLHEYASGLSLTEFTLSKFEGHVRYVIETGNPGRYHWDIEEEECSSCSRFKCNMQWNHEYKCSSPWASKWVGRLGHLQIFAENSGWGPTIRSPCKWINYTNGLDSETLFLLKVPHSYIQYFWWNERGSIINTYHALYKVLPHRQPYFRLFSNSKN